MERTSNVPAGIVALPYTCELCGKMHNRYESCHLPQVDWYAWGYEWIGEPVVRPVMLDQLCWVVPVRDSNESSIVQAHFSHEWELRCTGGGPRSPYHSHAAVRHQNYSYKLTIYRWVPELLEDAKRWQACRDNIAKREREASRGSTRTSRLHAGRRGSGTSPYMLFVGGGPEP